MEENACDATPVIFTELNWITQCGGQSGTDTMADFEISKVLLIYYLCTYSLANCWMEMYFIRILF